VSNNDGWVIVRAFFALSGICKAIASDARYMSGERSVRTRLFECRLRSPSSCTLAVSFLEEKPC
jgi:hypothetical protein